jgi:hypothetical protein
VRFVTAGVIVKGCGSGVNNLENRLGGGMVVRWRNSFKRLRVAQMSLHSDVTLDEECDDRRTVTYNAITAVTHIGLERAIAIMPLYAN